jgi:hypothetical protein
MELRLQVREGITDLRYLLGRGYNRESALRLIGDKYQLGTPERSLLFRCVYDPATVQENRSKIHPVEDLATAQVTVDGYNTVITVESYLLGLPVVLSDDGVVRDISEVHRKHRMTPTTVEALRKIANLLSSVRPSSAFFLYDAQVSRSGELCEKTREILNDLGVEGIAQTTRSADRDVLRSGGFICSSDYALIRKAEKVVDLAGTLIRRANYQNLVTLDTL